jgi:hypothetical protein
MAPAPSRRTECSRARAIDHDIVTTRAFDWERAGTLGVWIAGMHRDNRAHAEAVLTSCMRGKGYFPEP